MNVLNSNFAPDVWAHAWSTWFGVGPGLFLIWAGRRYRQTKKSPPGEIPRHRHCTIGLADVFRHTAYLKLYSAGDFLTHAALV